MTPLKTLLASGLSLAILASAATAAPAQAPSSDVCARLKAQGIDVPNCESLVGGGATGGSGGTVEEWTPILEGIAPSKAECDPYGDAFDVIGSFTNYSFWMTNKDGMAERQTLHGIYIMDASQNSEDAKAAALASVGAGEGCGELQGPAGDVARAYEEEFVLLTAALRVCAQDSTASKWKDCPDAMELALKKDDAIRSASGALGRYLRAVDSGKQQCLASDARAQLEEMRLTPCQRSNHEGVNRCASPRYGLRTGRIGQLNKVRGLLSQVRSTSALGQVSSKASTEISSAQGKLNSIVSNPAQSNAKLFDATFQVFAAQKAIQAGMKLCEHYWR